jgi:Tol biopolymer transport system component
MIGSTLAHYQITRHLGSGGFGDVYQATDSKLGRSVAIKLLPEAFARDAERVARFQREARVLASLNHPNIAAIYGLEESGGRSFLVMEFVPGETLAERIKRGAIPVEEALGIAAQIAEALEAAHESEKAIIHRDLKLANVMITPDGKIKVLDFGLAKAYAPDPADVSLSNSPTLSAAATNAGVILGTVAYMSPEQAKGLTVDRRTDIFAFGAVLYEMLTGRQAFQGDTVGDILAAVIRAEPDWKRLPGSVPLRVRELLRLCLQKDVKKRRQTAADVRIDIGQALAEPVAAMPAATPARSSRLAWIVAAAAVLVAVALALPAVRQLGETPPPSQPEMRTEIVTPATTDPISFALSPDGRQLAFVASGDGEPRLWLRPLAATSSQPLAGTEGAANPFWSPDSRSVGFFAAGKLKRLDIGGGLPQTLASAGAGRGGAWSPDGVILFVPTAVSPIFRVSAGGGDAVAVTKVDASRQITHRFPQFMPGGRQFLFYATGLPDAQGTYLGSLDAPETKRLTAADTAGVYAPPGWLLYVRQGTLVARRFDASRGELTGDPVTVADPVSVIPGSAGAFSVSAAGLVSYRAGGASRRQLVWFDRSGKTLGTLGAPDENGLANPDLSPDGRRVVVDRVVQGNTDIWLLDAARTTRFTFAATNETFPSWSPDASQIVFRSIRKGGANDLYQKPSNGAGIEEVLVESPQDKSPSDWSAAGILYQNFDPKTGYDLWVLPISGAREAQARQGTAVNSAGPAGRSPQEITGDPPWAFLKTEFEERHGQFSPDGRWVAYRSDESGRLEVYVRPFPGPGGQWQVSTAGGIAPRWRPDGKELYYIAPDSRMMAVPITTQGATLEPGTPVALFQTRIFGGGAYPNRQQYDVAPDGRFLINTAEETDASPITLLQNWMPPAN